MGTYYNAVAAPPTPVNEGPAAPFQFNEKGALDLIRAELVDKLDLTWDEASSFSNELVARFKNESLVPPKQPWIVRCFDSLIEFAKKYSGFCFCATVVLGLWTGLLTTYFFGANWPWYIMMGFWVTIVLCFFVTAANIVRIAE